jgi:hypothetical protein
VPFGLLCLSLTICWYALVGDAPADAAPPPRPRSWYQTKHAPSVADMLAAVRRVLIAAQYLPAHPAAPTTAEIHMVEQAWASAEA